MLGFSQFLTERRAHADKYERENVYKTIRKYASDPDVYVHFASIPKLGVTPVVRWETPHGVYGWSMKYHGPQVREQIDKILSMSISPRDEREWVEYRLAMKQLDKLVYMARDLRYYAELPGTDKQTKEYLEDKDVAVKALERAMNSRKDYRRMFEHVVFAMQANTAVKNVFDKYGIKTKNDFLMFLANMARTSVTNFADINSDARKAEIFGSQEKYKKAYGLYDLLYTVGDTDSPIGDVARDPIDIFPWASDRKYVFFFKPKANSDILKLQDHSTHFTSEGEANRFIENYSD